MEICILDIRTVFIKAVFMLLRTLGENKAVKPIKSSFIFIINLLQFCLIVKNPLNADA